TIPPSRPKTRSPQSTAARRAASSPTHGRAKPFLRRPVTPKRSSSRPTARTTRFRKTSDERMRVSPGDLALTVAILVAGSACDQRRHRTEKSQHVASALAAPSDGGAPETAGPAAPSCPARACKEQGECALEGGRCVAGSDLDCHASDACSTEGRCKTM